jgi:hypothetical protein
MRLPKRFLPFLLFVTLNSLSSPPAQAVTLCNVLGGPGCVPTTCSVLAPQTCLPDDDFPLGGDVRLTIGTVSAEAAPPKPDHDLNTLRDLFFTLRACWTPPATADAQHGMQMTVRVSYKKSGDIFAPPQMTYVLEGSSAKARDTYSQRDHAVAASLCAPALLARLRRRHCRQADPDPLHRRSRSDQTTIVPPQCRAQR